MNYQYQYYLIRLLIFFLSLLPFAAACWIARRAGDFFYVFAPKRRKVGLENLEHAYASALTKVEKKAVLRESFRNTALSILELFILEKTLKNPEQHFSIQGEENLQKALSYGKGVVLITSHLGSWEFLAFLFYLTGIPCSPVVKDIKNPYLNKAVDGLRRKMALTPIPKKNAARPILSELKKNHVVAILIDQWAGPEGIWVDFFGRPTSTTSLPARLAKKTGCALLPAYCLRRKNGTYTIEVQPPIQLLESNVRWEQDLTERLNQELADKVRLHPGQWSWAHRRWKPKPENFRTV